ncbi:hypothetical protein NPIL_65331 [Nephila pilipes]|uniref:Uncharacterized protein n=1 Tax=Nephila pilipes TaxID=299642 RepID=A0A8X6P167_NEPPI|nr:hypothetical protein NPIL_65331 [Nephila pilipes]
MPRFNDRCLQLALEQGSYDRFFIRNVHAISFAEEFKTLTILHLQDDLYNMELEMGALTESVRKKSLWQKPSSFKTQIEGFECLEAGTGLRSAKCCLDSFTNSDEHVELGDVCRKSPGSQMLVP